MGLLKEFKEQGYIILRGFFSQQEVDDISTAIEASQTPPECVVGDKYYHNVFQHSKEVRDFISQQKIVDFLKQFIGSDFFVRWDQAVEKNPGGGSLPWHQDNAYNKLLDTHYQFWVALTEVTLENGCLWLQPSSHKELLPHIKNSDDQSVCEITVTNPISIEANRGDIVLFSSLLLHKTTPNTSQGKRLTYVIEYMSLKYFDPSIDPPYFVVCRDGKSQPKYVYLYQGRLNPLNQLKYIGFRRE